MYALLKSDDYKGLTEMFYDNGLEIDVCDEAPEEVIQAWEMIEIDSGRRVGGMALEKRSGEYVLADRKRTVINRRAALTDNFSNVASGSQRCGSLRHVFV